MGSPFQSHQLSNGLYVSGRPEQPKERQPTMSSTAVPYTGGDIKKSGELGKMFDIEGSRSRKSGPVNSAPSRAGSFGGAGSYSGSMKKSSSGPLNKHGEPVKKASGPQSGGVSRQNSGPLTPVLPTKGLITSGPLNSAGAPRKASGPLDSTGSAKIHSTSIVHNQAVTKLSSVAGTFAWNRYWGRRAANGFIAQYPDAELRTARVGQFVKVTGVVTCGNVPLESSFEKVPRCVYTSTSLHEYRGWGSKVANPHHRLFTWGLRSLERHVVDFYISDFQSGLRALVKTGHGARVAPYVEESVVDIGTSNKDLSPEFLKWLAERKLSSDDRKMRLKEGYIKEGSTVSVMGVVQRHDNVLMIVPPPNPIPTGCQWSKCILPSSLEGIVLSCEDSSKVDVIPV